MRLGTMVVMLLVLPVFAEASTIENTLAQPCAYALSDPHMRNEFCKYQYDAGQWGDARDTCGSTDRTLVNDGGAIRGTFVPYDDVRDYYELIVPANASVRVSLIPSNPLERGTTQLWVFGASCGTLLLADTGYNGQPAIATGSLLAGTYKVGATYSVPNLAEASDAPLIPPVAVIAIGSLPARLAEVLQAAELDVHSGEAGFAISLPMQCEPICPAQSMDYAVYPKSGYKMKAQTN